MNVRGQILTAAKALPHAPPDGGLLTWAVSAAAGVGAHACSGTWPS